MAAQQRGEETRSRILEAALDCFARQGYDATGVAEICQRAGVTKGGFYHHFEGKQAVFLALMEVWLGGLDARLEAIRSGAATVPEELVRMTSMIRPVFYEAGGMLSIFLEFLIHAGRSPVVWQATVAPYRRYHTFFSRLVEAGIAEGSLRPVDPDLAAQVLLSFAVGLVAQGMFDPHGADWGAVAEEGMKMLLQGLAQEQTIDRGA